MEKIFPYLNMNIFDVNKYIILFKGDDMIETAIMLGIGGFLLGGASSVTGVGQGSADKAGQKGSEHLFVGVEKLIGVRIVIAGSVALTGATTTATVTFPSALPGVAADYIVICNGSLTASPFTPFPTAPSGLTVNSFLVTGTALTTVNYIVVKVNNATTTIAPNTGV